MQDLRFLEWEEGAELRLPSMDLVVKGKHARLDMEGRGMGIDPGRKLGVALIQHGWLSAWSLVMPKEVNGGEWGLWLGGALAEVFPGVPVVLEDAAPSKHFYQVPLAEIRFGILIGLRQGGANVTVLRPNSIRKQAFGSGKALATELWPPLPEHAADAAAMALVASIRNQE